MQKRQEAIPYQDVFEALNKAKVDYLVCGGAAVVMLGFSRLTIDLDLIVSLEKDNLKNLYSVLKKLSYKPNIPIKEEEFIRQEKLAKLAREKNMKAVSFYNTKDPFKIIDIGVNLPDIPKILKNKKYIKIKNISIPIIFIDDLIKMKKDLARPQDLIDVDNLNRIKRQEYEKKKKVQ